MTGVEFLVVAVCVLLGICLLPVALAALGTLLLYAFGVCLVIGALVAEAWGNFRDWLAR